MDHQRGGTSGFGVRSGFGSTDRCDWWNWVERGVIGTLGFDRSSWVRRKHWGRNNGGRGRRVTRNERVARSRQRPPTVGSEFFASERRRIGFGRCLVDYEVRSRRHDGFGGGKFRGHDRWRNDRWTNRLDHVRRSG